MVVGARGHLYRDNETVNASASLAVYSLPILVAGRFKYSVGHTDLEITSRRREIIFEASITSQSNLVCV